jgi:hypothetical protein
LLLTAALFACIPSIPSKMPRQTGGRCKIIKIIGENRQIFYTPKKA